MAQGETSQRGNGAAPRHHPSVAQAGRMALAAGLALLPMNTVRAQAPQPAQVPQPASQSSPVSSAPPPGPVPPTPPGLLQSLQTQSSLLGDMLGVRPWLAARGITTGINETSEVLANVTGGVKTGPAYDGLTLLSAGLDTERAFGWHGGTFNLSALWIHGRNLSQDNLGQNAGGILQTPSGIEAERTFRLWEAWFDQATPGGNADIKIGQQSIDQEFITSTYTTLFINTMMGWPALPSYDMYAGGPAYPLSSLGVRLRGSAGPFTALLGVFDDNPPGGPFSDDDQLRGRERGGLGFNFNTGALVIGELQFALHPVSSDQSAKPTAGSVGLPGIYRIGAWFDSGAFPDQRVDENGVSLASPASDGIARPRRHDFAIYTSCDQQLWQDKAGRAVGVFARLMGAPGDRNLISFSTNLGLSVKAPFTSRPNDTVGIGYGLARVSSSASALDEDTRDFSGNDATPIRSTESFIEVTYQAQITPWWSVQPDFQYIFTPGGGVSNPDNPGGSATPRIANEAIFGLRTGITL
jgi:porin